MADQSSSVIARQARLSLADRLALYSIESYGHPARRFPKCLTNRTVPERPIAGARVQRQPRNPMAKLLLTVGFLALAVGLLWIGQGTGAIKWPEQSFMINQIQWAGYGMALAAFGLILIWQGKR